MWYFIWNFTCEFVRRSSISAFKTSPYLDFLTMLSTALRPNGKMRTKTLMGVVTKGNRCYDSIKCDSTPTFYEVLCEFARVGNGKPPAACIPHSQDPRLNQLPVCGEKTDSELIFIFQNGQVRGYTFIQ